MKNEVRVVAFITTKDEGVKHPIPGNYLLKSELPKELNDAMRSVGWSDEQGNICFPEGFRPAPVKGSDGNVYLCVGSDTMENERTRMEVMMGAMTLLNLEEGDA